MTEYTFEDLAPGDVIKTHRTVEVLLKEHDEIFFRDVRSGQQFYLSTREGVDHGSLLYEMVIKAKPNPKVGDTVSGRELFDRDWPEGSVVKSQGTGLAYMREGNEWRRPKGFIAAGTASNFTILDIPTKGNSNG